MGQCLRRKTQSDVTYISLLTSKVSWYHLEVSSTIFAIVQDPGSLLDHCIQLYVIYIYIYIYIQGVVQLCYPLLSLITNQDLHVEYHVPLGKLQLRMQGCCHHHKATTPITQRRHHWRSYKLRLKHWKLELRWSVWDPDGSRFV